MNSINKPERATQDRAIALFTQQLGYRYLGNMPRPVDFSNTRAGPAKTPIASRPKICMMT